MKGPDPSKGPAGPGSAAHAGRRPQGSPWLRFTLRQLEYLVAVGEHGSISIAAERRKVSAPSVSVAISQLEAELGVPLFIRRHAQGMVATPQGQVLIGHARDMLGQARLLVEAANRLSGSVSGSLTVGCLSTFAQVVLPRVRRAFSDAHAAVDFRQVEADQSALIEGLRIARIDVALTYDLAIPTDLVFAGLANLPPYVMLPDGHALAGRSALAIADLADEPMILLDLPHSVDYFLAILDGAGIRPRIAERTRDIALVQSMVGNGFGWSIANLKPLSDRSPDGRQLRFVPLAGRHKPLRMGLLMVPGAEDLPTNRALVSLCRAMLPGYVAGSLAITSEPRHAD